MRRKELERKLLEHGWVFKREGGNHWVFAKPGHRDLPVPRHNEINEYTARGILKRAVENG